MEISVNIENDYIKWLQEIAQDASSTKEDVIHSFTVKCIKEYKLRKAVRRYSEREISIGKAAEIAGMPERDFLHKLQEIGIPLNVDESDFIKGFDVLRSVRKYPIV